MPRIQTHRRASHSAARTTRGARTRARARARSTRRDGVRCQVDGHWLLNFCSNDYLGLSQHSPWPARCRNAPPAKASAASHRTWSAATAPSTPRWSARSRDWTGRERALLFRSGYMANLGVMQALLRRQATSACRTSSTTPA